MGEDQIYELEIDLKEWLFTLYRKKWILVVVTLLAFVATLLASHFLITPYYESTARIYVLGNEAEEDLTYWDLQMGNDLTLDYQELILSRPVLEAAIESLQLKMSYSSLASRISISIPADTRIVIVTVRQEDATTAMNITNAILDSLEKQVSQMGIQTFSVLEDASLPQGTSSPSAVRNAVLGGAAGAFFIIFIISLLFILDDKIKTTWDIEKRLGITTLASIPKLESIKKRNKR